MDPDELTPARLSATLEIPQKLVSLRTSADLAAHTLDIRADMEAALAQQLRHAVVDELAHGAGMDVRTFKDFLRFLSEDGEIQSRFTGWRAKRRLLD